MIPLMRPFLPVASLVRKQLQLSKKRNTYCNFGPNYHIAVQLLNNYSGRNVLPVTNGTVAIQLACQTTLPKGSRVVIPDFTHIGTYVGVKDAGMIPIFSDTSFASWTLNLKTLEKRLDSFDAMVVVAPFGYSVNTFAYEYFASKYNKKIIYDFAGAWGQFPKTKFPVCYSLHATKGWTCGEGGLVSFDNEREFESCRRLTNFNIAPSYRIDSDMGGNYKLDEFRCAMIVAHLMKHERIESKLEKRFKIMQRYEESFQIKVPYDYRSTTLAVFPHFLKIDPSKHVKKFACKFYFPLLTNFPHLKHVHYFEKSTDFFRTCLAIPIDVSEKEQNTVIKSIKHAIQ